jgi:hypothetical protein
MPNTSPSPGYPETLTLTIRTPLERLLVERALVMAQELEAVSEVAEPGRVLDCCEEAAVVRGREFTRLALETAMQGFVGRQEKKTTLGPAPAAAVRKTREQTPRTR